MELYYYECSGQKKKKKEVMVPGALAHFPATGPKAEYACEYGCSLRPRWLSQVRERVWSQNITNTSRTKAHKVHPGQV